jgi:hypothetical protein
VTRARWAPTLKEASSHFSDVLLGLSARGEGIEDGVYRFLALDAAVPGIVRVYDEYGPAIAGLQAAGRGHAHARHAAVRELRLEVGQEAA